jgi:L-rhamnose-H+ transport protein
MSEHFWLGMAIIFLSGVANGGFSLPMKRSRRWQWENTWFVFATLTLVIVPWSLAGGFVPQLHAVYRGLSSRALFYPLLFGFLWGFAQVTFGLALKTVGVALTFAVTSALGSLSGSLVPLLVFDPAGLFRARGLLLLLSIPILILGLVLYGIAGRRREKEQAARAANAVAAQGGFATGLALCIFTGIFGSCFNVGFAFGNDVVRAALQHGATPVTSTYAVWAVVFSGGFVPNLGYCAYRLVRNRSFPLFLRSGSPREALLSVAMAALWATAIFSYGIGATCVGKYGTSIGFMLFVASSILAGNAFGILSGEWRGTVPTTRKLLVAAIALILAAVVVLNLGGLF